MQSAKQGQRSFAVKLSNVPVVVFEDQLAGKENAMRKFGADRFGKLRQLYPVSAEAKIGLCGMAPIVAEVDEVIERLVRITSHRFQGLRSTKAHGINRANVHKYEIAKMVGKLPCSSWARVAAAESMRSTGCGCGGMCLILNSRLAALVSRKKLRVLLFICAR
jgi:hypothetical protein